MINGDVPLITAEAIAGPRRGPRGRAARRARWPRWSSTTPASTAASSATARATSSGSSRPRREGDATPEQLAIREVNTGVYAFDGASLLAALAEIDTDNAQGELYLPDVLPEAARGRARRSPRTWSPITRSRSASTTASSWRSVRKLAQQRIHDAHARNGVTIVDPDSTLIDVEVDDRPRHGRRAEHVHPRRHDDRRGLRDRPADDDHRLHARRRRQRPALLSRPAPRVDDFGTIGPFAYLRPDAHLHPNAKAGAFVEIKNSTIGQGTKVPHLSYIGDADIGENTNIGAGNITANYDGRTKHRTTIGANVRTSVDTAFVAPVEVGDGAYTGAGSVITEDVPANALGDRPRPAEEHRGLCGAARSVTTARASYTPPRRERAVAPHLIGHVAAAQRLRQAADAVRRPLESRAGREDRQQAGRRPRRRDAEDVLQRRGLLPLRGVDPRRGRVHRPADVRQPGHRASPPTTR